MAMYSLREFCVKFDDIRVQFLKNATSNERYEFAKLVLEIAGEYCVLDITMLQCVPAACGLLDDTLDSNFTDLMLPGPYSHICAAAATFSDIYEVL